MTAIADTFFDRTTVLEPIAPDRFRATLDPAWSSLNGMLGGYVVAHAVRAVETVQPECSVRTISVSFLRPTTPGDVELSVTPVRVGRSVSVYDVVFEQGARVTLRATVTTAAATLGGAAVWDTDRLELPPPPELCEPLSLPDGPVHFRQATARLDPASLPFSGGSRALVTGWVRPLESRPIDTAWLAMILDWFPPAAFVRAQPPIGGVSIDYTVHIHRTAQAIGDGWLAGMFRADTAIDGLALEHGVIAFPDGSPLAESFHTRVA